MTGGPQPRGSVPEVIAHITHLCKELRVFEMKAPRPAHMRSGRYAAAAGRHTEYGETVGDAIRALWVRLAADPWPTSAPRSASNDGLGEHASTNRKQAE